MNNGQRSSYIKGRVIIGFFLLILGVLFFIQNMGIADVRPLFRYWPVIFVILGLHHLVQHHTIAGIIWGGLLILFGVGLLLPLLNINIHIFDFWPLLLVLLGIAMIAKGIRAPACHPPIQEVQSSESYIRATVFMGGVRKVVLSDNFTGGELTATMGGLQIDLRDSEIQTEATFDVFVVMGGIEIIIPQEWKVVIDTFPVLGGVSDSTVVPKIEHPKLLRIKGTVILGGVEIKNYPDEDWGKTHHR